MGFLYILILNKTFHDEILNPESNDETFKSLRADESFFI